MYVVKTGRYDNCISTKIGDDGWGGVDCLKIKNNTDVPLFVGGLFRTSYSDAWRKFSAVVNGLEVSQGSQVATMWLIVGLITFLSTCVYVAEIPIKSSRVVVTPPFLPNILSNNACGMFHSPLSVCTKAPVQVLL